MAPGSLSFPGTMANFRAASVTRPNERPAESELLWNWPISSAPKSERLRCSRYFHRSAWRYWVIAWPDARLVHTSVYIYVYIVYIVGIGSERQPDGLFRLFFIRLTRNSKNVSWCRVAQSVWFWTIHWSYPGYSHHGTIFFYYRIVKVDEFF